MAGNTMATICLYAAIIAIGLISSRAPVLGAGNRNWTLIRTVLAGASSVALISLVVWGFATLTWYWPIGVFLVGSVLGELVTQINRSALFPLSAILDLVATVGGLYLWIWHWPF